MSRTSRWMKWMSAPILTLLLAVAACSDQGTPAEQLLGPEQAQMGKGGNRDGGSQKGRKGPVITDGATGRSWKLATGKLARADSVKDERIIGPEGGTLYTATHALYVPEGAVAQPTKFKIQAFRSPVDATLAPDSAEVVVGVALKAYTVDEAGNALVDIGAQGFRKPVYLALSYSWVSEVIPDLSQAKILWLKTANEALVTRTFELNYNGKWIVSELDHFSDYAIGFPN